MSMILSRPFKTLNPLFEFNGEDVFWGRLNFVALLKMTYCIIVIGKNMSGHSHYATIKRQKEVKDTAKGKIFSKLGRAISIAVKTGGGIDPNTNYKLRMAVDAARSANTPKDNIDRAILRAQGGEDMQEVVYEGFGPYGIAVMVEVATDNRNRTGQEIKNLFERVGGSLGGPGSVSFNFEPKGLILIDKPQNSDEMMLKLIDLGIEDIDEGESVIETYVSQVRLHEMTEKLKEEGFKIISSELTQKPVNYQTINDVDKASKVLNFLNLLNDNGDVQKVFANLDIPENIIKSISSSS